MEPAKPPRLVISQRRADHKLCGNLLWREREREDGDSLNGLLSDLAKNIHSVARNFAINRRKGEGERKGGERREERDEDWKIW